MGTDTEPRITPDIAAHVLFHLGRGGWPGSNFIQKLLAAFEAADAHNVGLLGAGYPAYATAWTLAKTAPNGVDLLRTRADENC